MNKKIVLTLMPLLVVACSQEASGTSSSEAPASSTSEPPAASSSTTSEPTSSEARGITFQTASVYEPSYNAEAGLYGGKEKGKVLYFIDPDYGETKAFVSVNSFLGAMDIAQTYEVSFEGGTLTYEFSGNMGTFSIDGDGDCTFTSFCSLSSLGLNYPLGLNEVKKDGHRTEMVNARTVKDSEITYSLSDYSLPFYIFENDAYLLTQVISVFFLHGRLESFVFNGTNFYDISSISALQRNEVEGTFSDHYYSTSKTIGDKTKSEAAAKLDADSFLFTLDMCYGFQDEPDFADGYGAYLQKNYPTVYSDLYSTDVETVLTAYDTIICTIMGDGHSSLATSSSGDYGSFYNGGSHAYDAEKSPFSDRYNKLMADAITHMTARQQALGLAGMSDLGDKCIEISGDTAVIRFDSFITSSLGSKQSDETYAAHVADDNFSLFYTAYKQIAASGTVKNVIVDVSCNGGGSAYALLEVLGFVLDNPSFIIYDHSSRTSMEAVYRTDCDADGSFMDNDSPASKYTHYVLTSGFSFSCGNAFPYFSKLGGIKTIGQQSGGGSCVVMPMVTGEGYPFNISGPNELAKTKLSDPSIDGGVAPDIEIPLSDFYDIEKLKTYLA